jgi:hypothetical protein
MTPRRRWTVSLLSAGIALLLFGAWMLHITLPSRLQAYVPTRNPRKMVRGQQSTPQKRSACEHEAPALACHHDFTLRDPAS